MKATSEAGPLLMGAAAVEVTPLGPVALSGFGARTLPSTGVHDGLYARALAVAERGGAPVVIVTVDVLGVGSDLVAEVRAGLARAGVDRGRVAVVATHTHAGPATLRRAFLGDVDAVVVSRIVDGAVAAGRAALEALEPAEVRFGRRPVPGVARNRRVAGGPVDDELAVLSFWRPGGTTPAALLVSFALHPVVLGPDNLLVSRDYVGYVVDAVESDHPGATVLFACGCAGQVNSGHPATASWTTAAAAGRTFEAAAAIGGTLSAAVRDVVAVGSVAVAGPGDGGPRSAAPRPEPRAQQHVVAPRVAVAGVTVDLTLSEVDSEPDAAIEAECPPLPEGVSPGARIRELERELRIMGPINPLALQEFEELQERHSFLEGQLEDIRQTRRELAKVIRAVDEEIVKVFSAAYADVTQNFTMLFETLFPGGEGRLKLTEPNDLLSTGIEIEAKPSGKNVRKLSLLSGGERSLTALAFLFAVFRSRPSPFYVMDEVEAALDDVNLHRFLDLVNEFRRTAQLIIVSHQKRTMEAADGLYGGTMEPGGSSKVVSEKATAVLEG